MAKLGAIRSKQLNYPVIKSLWHPHLPLLYSGVKNQPGKLPQNIFSKFPKNLLTNDYLCIIMASVGHRTPTMNNSSTLKTG